MVLQGIQQSTCKVYGHTQHMFLQFFLYYSLLPVPADQETLLCFATFLADAKGLQHGTILRYLYGMRVLHFDMSLSDPLKGALQLHKGLQAIHIQSNPASCKLAFTYELLVLTCPLHKFPVELQYITIHLKVSKTDPFGQGTNVIIGCSDTQVCRACSAWDFIQSHWAKQASPTVPFFKLSGQPLSRSMMVGHIKGLPAKLGLNPSLYSGHSMHTVGSNHGHCGLPQELKGD